MKKPDLSTIWQKPAYLSYIQPELTEEIIREAEAKIGYKLPKEYLDILRIQNGGYIRYTLKNTPNEVIYGIGPYYPSILQFDLLIEYKDYVSFKLDGLFPFDGDGHWNICLDYRQNASEPEVTFVDTESDSEEKITSTFKDYLNLLEIDMEEKFVIETASPIEEIIAQVSSIIATEFEKPDYWAHGYPEYKTQFEGSWIFITPNKVPKGFVRKDDDRYEELKSQMEGTALRFPEIAEDNLFIFTWDDDIKQILFERLKNGGLSIKRFEELV